MNNGTLYNYDTPYITSSFLFDNKVLLISRELNEYYTNPQVSQLKINFFNDGIIEIERNLISSSEEYFHIQDVFYNSEFGFFCGDNGLYSVSSDLGKNWTSRVIEGYEDRNFTSIYFNSNSEGILATDKGEILMSTDNGQSWSLKFDLGKKINDIKFLNQNKFIVIGDEGLLEILEF